MTESNNEAAQNDSNVLSKEEYKLLSKAEKKELECSVQMTDEEIKEAREACENCCSYYSSVFKLYNIEPDDVVSDTLVKAIRFRHTFKNQSKFSTWIYRICSNTLLNTIQSAKRTGDTYSSRREYIEEGEGEINFDQVMGHEPEESLEDSILHEERKKKLYELIDRLPENLRTVMLMYTGEMMFREMAEQLDKPRGTCQSSYHKAKMMMIDMVNEEFQDYK